jgi:hypothetical protein
MRVFRSRTSYFKALPSVFHQAQFIDFEDIVLDNEIGLVPFVIDFPRLELQFSLEEKAARIELARVLFVFKRIFNLKPAITRGRPDGYRVSANFSGPYAAHLLGFFMRLRFTTRTKFLRFFFPSNTVDFRFILLEPITFFPLIHPGFDYHDWYYPFEFQINFSSIRGVQLDYFAEVVTDVFDVLLIQHA